MAYIKLDAQGVVIQKQPYAEQGFIYAPDNVVCGMIKQGDRYVSPPPSPASVPASVTRAQGKAALIQAGLWPSVIEYAEGIADPIERALAEVALNDTTEWLRTSPFLNAAADAIGLSQEQLDDLFREAAAIAL